MKRTCRSTSNCIIMDLQDFKLGFSMHPIKDSSCYDLNTSNIPRDFFFLSFFLLFHHLQPADPTSNPACGHMTSPLTLQEVRYLSSVLEERGSTITRARRLLLLPVESVYPPILKPSISSRHQHNTHSLQVRG